MKDNSDETFALELRVATDRAPAESITLRLIKYRSSRQLELPSEQLLPSRFSSLPYYFTLRSLTLSIRGWLKTANIARLVLCPLVYIGEGQLCINEGKMRIFDLSQVRIDLDNVFAK